MSRGLKRSYTAFGSNGEAPPAPRGLAHLKIMRIAARDINAAVMALTARYGECFAFGFAPIRFHWLIGPEALRFALAEAPERFISGRAYSFLRTIGGATALITSDEPAHLTRRRLVQPAFHGQRLKQELAQLAQASAEFCAALPRGEPFDLYPRLQRHNLRLIAELLLGAPTLARLPTLLGEVQRMMDFANRPFLAQLIKLPLPGTPWGRFVAARRRLDRALYAEIARRKAQPPRNYLLDLLLAARDEAGAGLSDRELRDQLVSLISAGFDTTSAGAVWALYLLLEHPHYLAALREELVPLTPEGYLKAPLLDAVVKETLRLYPPAPAALRELAADTTYKRWRLPKGGLVALSIYATQRSAAAFEAPLRFWPERWQRPPPPFSYLPFGYGQRYCIGAQLATILIKLLLAELIVGYELSKAWRAPLAETGNTVHPKGGLPLLLRRR